MFPPQSEEWSLLQKICAGEFPRHVAIIMDGNGRWAEKRGLTRIEGHKKGGDSALNIIELAAHLGISYLTLYTFSTENWLRPISEVRYLFRMLYENLQSKRKLLEENDIRLFVLGDRENIPKRLWNRLNEIIEATKSNRKMQVNLAFNYGSRLEIVEAIKKIIRAGLAESEIDTEKFQEYLYTRGIPDPDLIIRTSGEMRISNFLLYQAAYSEFVFSPVLWPDFGARDLLTALLDFQSRKRRYGRL